MSNEEAKEVPKKLIEDLKVFLKFYEYGCHILDGLVKRHLEGTDIIPQITTLGSNNWARGIFTLLPPRMRMPRQFFAASLSMKMDAENCQIFGQDTDLFSKTFWMWVGESVQERPTLFHPLGSLQDMSGMMKPFTLKP